VNSLVWKRLPGMRGWLLPLIPAVLLTSPSPFDAPAVAAGTHQVFAYNNLGMHCIDPDFSVFSILPLFNVVNAQVIQKGIHPVILGNPAVTVTYQAARDSSGSLNSTSRGKTNFWRYVSGLFGLNRRVNVGLLGARMPGPMNLARPFKSFAASSGVFSAVGIPITSLDDRMKANPYPLMKIKASSGRAGLSSVRAVVPVSDEMNCDICHASGGDAANDPSITWSADPDPVLQYRKNILILHDARMGTSLVGSQPVLCASCHYSLALDLGGTGPGPGQAGKPFMSRAVHGFHVSKMPLDPSGTTTCYNCHPGRRTQCLRGVMSAYGEGCVDCHGSMAAVASVTRQPWADEPKCQSCHTGDALANLGGLIVRRTAYQDSPDTATPIIAANGRFAEEPGTLYRNSRGHGGVACQACHGSTHAEWPSRVANDNVAAAGIQGHTGYIIECAACHGAGLPLTLNGPHGLHNVNDQSWVNGHDEFFTSSADTCRACHGLNGEGTNLSRAAAARGFTVEEFGTVSILPGTEIGCGLCHSNPLR
jgi:hypothetical protein